jgi:hypothetical protein
MDEENVMYVKNGVLFSHKEEKNHVVCRKMNGFRDHTECSKSNSKFQILHVVHQENLGLK